MNKNMENLNDIKIRIERYLDGTFSESEKTEFEKIIKSDPFVQKEFTAALFERLGTSSSSTSNEKEWFASVYKEMKPVELNSDSNIVDRKSPISWKFVKYAAAACVILACTIYIFYNNHDEFKPNSAAPFTHMMVDPGSYEEASADNSANTSMDSNKLASFYYFKNIPWIDSLEPMALACNGFCVPKYYLAHAYLKTKQYDKANLLFKELIAESDEMEKFPPLQGREMDLKLNSMIAKAGAKDNVKSIIPELDQFLSHLQKSDSLYFIANQLRKALD